jgi:hypothetical protein
VALLYWAIAIFRFFQPAPYFPLHWIASPLLVLAVGAAVPGIVWKFFDRTEKVLKEETKREIAAWLRGHMLVFPKRSEDPRRIRTASLLFYLFMKRQEVCDALIGDLEERFASKCTTSFYKPRSWYWRQVISSIGSSHGRH